MTRQSDVAIIGGGLSGGLIALALSRIDPTLSLTLIEAGETLGGNHRWSWFSSDLNPFGRDLMAEFSHESWDGGYDVRFPAYERELSANYNSLGSPDFARLLEQRLNQGSIITGRKASDVSATQVTLDTGEIVEASVTIDCRGISEAPSLTGGWQVFLGQSWLMYRPHKVVKPVIMDVKVAQKDGYRFVYVLPMDERRLFIEDTYYNDAPTLDRAELRARIAEYVEEHGWSGSVEHEETGVLPVIVGGNFTRFQSAHRIQGVAMAGARGGFVHPLTSYTLPKAAEIAELIAREITEGRGDTLAVTLEREAQQHWRDTSFYRLLAKMLFGAASPQERYRVFEHFYRLPGDLVERFYSCRSTPFDKARILIGKPPLPISRAVAAIISHRANPLTKEPAA